MKNRQEYVETGSFFCRIDKIFSLRDYPPHNNCMRFFGIFENVFNDEDLLNNYGCEVYLIDIKITDLMKLNSIDIYFLLYEQSWVKIDYVISQNSHDNYFYELFSDNDPTFINVTNFELLNGPLLKNNPVSQVDLIEIEDDQSSQWVLDSFHVGQGMCSLLHNNDTGFIIDCGAGKPIFRNNYRNKKNPIQNDLINILNKITINSKIPLIVSHSDSDHWRLIDWDTKILTKIEKIYIPDGTVSLATKSKHIIGIVFPISDTIFMKNNSGSTYFSAYRSQPSYSDNNGECLVCLIKVKEKKSLLPGDYVYRRIIKDNNKNISNMASYKYHAIVVPHHGDTASSFDIFDPYSDEAISFFSAGNRYGHPTLTSINNHIHKGYKTISDPKCMYIKIVSLLS